MGRIPISLNKYLIGPLEFLFLGIYAFEMKKLIFTSFLLFISTLSFAEVAKLKYSTDFLLEKVLEKKNLKKRSDIPLPVFFYASNTSLVQFQDAIEKQWGFRPDMITNAFAAINNEIYILDEAEYYKKSGRCMDDSVVHELVHYVQVKYLNWDLNDESLEWDAIDIQSAFRDEFCPVSKR